MPRTTRKRYPRRKLKTYRKKSKTYRKKAKAYRKRTHRVKRGGTPEHDPEKDKEWGFGDIEEEYYDDDEFPQGKPVSRGRLHTIKEPSTHKPAHRLRLGRIPVTRYVPIEDE